MRRALVVLVLVLTGSSLPTPAGAAKADPLQAEQWGLARVRAPQAWSRATGKGVVVAIVDTGVDKDHPEFKGKLVKGASWVGCPGATPCFKSSQWDDKHGHGTHVAGIVAAPRNGKGVVGVAPNAKIMPLRVLDANGEGFKDDGSAAIRYAVKHGASVINLSLGGYPIVGQLTSLTGDDAGWSSAIAYARQRGVLLVAAAGNTSTPLCSDDTAFSDNALCVAAIDRFDLKAYYSEWGVGLDIVAPGGLGSVFCDDPDDVLSTYALGATSACGSRKGYETLSGSSMAAGFVSGVGALLAQRKIKGTKAVARLRASASDLGIPGYDPVFGAGVVDAARAVS